jgi:hypothetical protein
VALMLLEATWKGTLYVEGSVQKTWLFMERLRHRLGAQDYDTLLLFLHTIYGHVVLEISWAAWAGAIMALECGDSGENHYRHRKKQFNLNSIPRVF